MTKLLLKRSYKLTEFSVSALLVGQDMYGDHFDENKLLVYIKQAKRSKMIKCCENRVLVIAKRNLQKYFSRFWQNTRTNQLKS